MMNRFLLALLLSVVSLFVHAQSMELTANDFVDKSDPDKDYVVLNFPGKSQNELYKAALKYMHSYYNKPEKVLTKIEGEQLVIDAMEQKAVVTSGLGSKYPWNFYYKMTLDFKDGKMRFSPNYKYVENSSGIQYPLVGKQSLWVKNALYNTKGKLSMDKIKEGVDKFVNQYIAELSQAIQSDKSNDDW
jgi:hypothetical protein